MFEAIISLLPAEWQGAAQVLLAPLRWNASWQGPVLDLALSGATPALVTLSVVGLLLPLLLAMAGAWATALSLYTIPFRSGRGAFLTAMLLAWWDAARCVWLFWSGFVRVGVALVGWVVGGVRFALHALKNLLVGALRSPLTLLDWTSRSYFKPGVPWLAFLVLVLWCAIEATIFTFTVRPMLTEVFAGITGVEPDPRVMAPLLWLFMLMMVAGSFACMQGLAEAIETRAPFTIVKMAVVEVVVMGVEVVFLYRELVDSVTPWLAQQSGGEFHLGVGATLAFASCGWMGVRGMSWFLFGRYGTPALLAVLSRQTLKVDGEVKSVPPPVQPDLWKAPIAALKAETEWFHAEARRMFELLSLPVLQLLAAAMNFFVVAVQSRPLFVLPFTSLDDVMAAAPFGAVADRDAPAAPRLARPGREAVPGVAR
ncbi:MAG TPA: hypothetical protein VNA89_11855 [Gemmatimonadaceae bacterium]|nr:hypothetical protein [Gemmatimonadaceae bacterium]